VRRVELEVRQLRADMARADSARAEFLDFTFQQIIALQRQVLDSLEAQDRRVALQLGTVRTDLTEVQRQLVQIQELTGQSQQRLSELQRRLQERERQPAVVAPAGPDSAGAAVPAAGEESAEYIYDVAIRQLDRGSPQTARSAFQMLLQQYPDHPRAEHAQFHLGETWERSDPDSAAAAYESVVRNYPNSPRAPTALYRLGLIAEQRGDMDAARVYYTRVVSGYPQSDAAQLARAKLNPEH